MRIFTCFTIFGLGLVIGQDGRDRKCFSGLCGTHGECVGTPNGSSRCKCEDGFMGVRCERPCQDVYQSCDRWKKERRCIWGKRYTNFWNDNCASSCETCTFTGKNVLTNPFPPILEKLSWLEGTWETTTTIQHRYPVDFDGPYKETIQFSAWDIPMFDRPALNYSAHAVSLSDPSDQHIDLGFVTTKAAVEDTGFGINQTSTEPNDPVAIEMNSNTGFNVLEEGEFVESKNELNLNTTWVKTLPNMESLVFKTALRRFRLNNGFLEENTNIEMPSGKKIRFTKYFTKIDTLLDNFKNSQPNEAF